MATKAARRVRVAYYIIINYKLLSTATILAIIIVVLIAIIVIYIFIV